MLDNELRTQLMKFVQFVTTHPLPIHEQRGIGKGKNWFPEDWQTVEIAKYLFNGESMYKSDPPPWRLRDNKSFDKENIIKLGNQKIKLLEELEKHKDKTNLLVIDKVGRGIDIVIATFVKKWDKIICYDDNNQYEKPLNMWFGGQGINIEFVRADYRMPLESDKEAIIIKDSKIL